MTARLVVVAMLMLPGLAAAQHVPPQPIPPPPNILTSNRQDIFRTPPDTYMVKPPEDLGLFVPQPPLATVWPVWGSSVWPGYYPELYRRAGEVRPEPPTMRIIVEHVLPPQAPVATVPPAATMPAVIPPEPGHKRTLYVIPGCYAGDKLPRAEQLRAGCSLRNVRTISPAL